MDLDVLEKRRISCLGTRRFIKYQYSYMFRPREILIRLALEHSTWNIQIALLEVRSHVLHSTFIIAVFLSNKFKLLMSIKDTKMSCIKLLKFNVGRCQRGLRGCRVLCGLSYSAVCWVRYDIFL